MTTIKTCRDCSESKPLGQFYKHKMMADGHLNKCKSCVKKRVNKERTDNIEKHRARDRARGYREYDPKKAKARRAVRSLDRPDGCSHCGEPGKVEGHHPDYDQPLAVVWLCKPCHTEVHL